MRILFLATYFPRPLNPTIGTWALEQAKALRRAVDCSHEIEDRRSKIEDGETNSLDTSDPPPVTSFRVISGNPWFPKFAGRLRGGIRAYSDCPRSHSWDGVEVDYLPMFFYPFGKLDAIFNRVGEPMLKLGWWSIKRRLMKIVEEFRPDVVYAHHSVPNGYFAMRIKKETGIPFFVTEHDMDEVAICSRMGPRRFVYEAVFQEACRVVAVSALMKKEMLAVVPNAKIEIIHSP